MQSNPEPRIGGTIRQRRKWLEMGQGELAERAGISRATLALIEHGHRSSPRTIDRLERALDEAMAEHARSPRPPFKREVAA